MRYLLDTHVLLWSRASPERLSPQAVALLQSTGNTLYVSMATLWECAIKVCIGKLAVPDGLRTGTPACLKRGTCPASGRGRAGATDDVSNRRRPLAPLPCPDARSIRPARG